MKTVAYLALFLSVSAFAKSSNFDQTMNRYKSHRERADNIAEAKKDHQRILNDISESEQKDPLHEPVAKIVKIHSYMEGVWYYWDAQYITSAGSFCKASLGYGENDYPYVSYHCEGPTRQGYRSLYF